MKRFRKYVGESQALMCIVLILVIILFQVIGVKVEINDKTTLGHVELMFMAVCLYFGIVDVFGGILGSLVYGIMWLIKKIKEDDCEESEQKSIQKDDTRV